MFIYFIFNVQLYINEEKNRRQYEYNTYITSCNRVIRHIRVY